MEPEKSFNDAMNDWAARQSFFRNTGNRLIHPDPDSHWVLRLLGYVFRLTVIVCFAILIGRVALKKYVMSKGFSERAAASFAELLKAEKFESSSLLWKGTRVSLKEFNATGSEAAAFRTLNADFLQFEADPLSLLGETWDLGDIVVSRLDAEFRSGAVTSVPLSSVSRKGQLLVAGIGDAPDFTKLKYGVISVAEGNLRWGLSESTLGGYMGGFTFQKGEGAAAWQLGLAGGVFQQNWLQNVTVERMSVKRVGDKLVIEDGLLAFKNGGTAIVKGRLELGALPQANITLQMTMVDLNDLIPEKFSGYLDGRVSGPLTMTGSINTQAGIAIDGILSIKSGRIRNVPVFESLALLTQVSRFRQLPLSSGTFRIHTGADELKISDIDLKSEEFGALMGGFTVSRSAELTTEEEMINDQLKADGKELKRVPYHVTGTLDVAVINEKLKEFQSVTDKYFKKKETDFSWMSVYLSGEVQNLTRGVYEEMVNEVKLNRIENR